MKLWQAFGIIFLSFLVVCGIVGGNSFPLAADAAPQAGDFPLPSRGPLPGPARAAPQAGDYGAQLVTLVNAQRAAAGLSPLRTYPALVKAADAHNGFMASINCFAHQCPGEAAPGARAVAAGYPSSGIGENIAAGYVTPQDAVTGWMNSPGHRANVLGSYTDIGCAYLASSGSTTYGTYWTCDFGSAGGPIQPTATLPPPGATLTPRPPPALTPQPTPRGALPPAGWIMRVELSPSAGWQAWDNLYYAFCAQPLTGVTCRWYRP